MGTKEGIQYSLRKNPFREDGKYIASTVTRASLSLEGIVRQMSIKGTTLTEVDIKAVIVLFRNEIIEALSSGTGVNIDNFFFIKASISGIYENLNDSFDPARHSLNINMIPSGKFMRDVKGLTKVEKVDRVFKGPEIYNVYDGQSKTTNLDVTVNSLVKIEGKNMAFDSTADDEGLFLISADGTQSIKVNYTDDIGSKTLRFVLPPEAVDLGATILVEVRSRLRTKILKKGTTEFLLNVKSN